MYHSLIGSKFGIFKGECRHSQAINSFFYKFLVNCWKAWLILEKTRQIWDLRASLTSSSNQGLSCRKEVEPSKIKNIDFNWEGLSYTYKQNRSLVSTPKKDFQPLAKTFRKLLTSNGFDFEMKAVL